MKEAKENPSNHPTLETLAEAAISIQPPETSQGVVNPPSTEPAKEESWADGPKRNFLEETWYFLENRAFDGLGGC